jgi:mRNA interferase RelE/StbE
MLKINLSRQAERLLRNLPVKTGKPIAKKLVALQTHPYPPTSKSLRGYPDWYRAKSGEYRIIYQVEQDTLIVLLIGKRNDDEIYKLLGRLI